MVEESKAGGKPAIKSALRRSNPGAPKMAKSVSYGEVREDLTPITERESESS